MKETIKLGIAMVLNDKGLEDGIKEMLNTSKEYKEIAKDKYIEDEGNEDVGTYHNEIAYATFQLEVINAILSYRPLYEDRKHIKTLCDEIRLIADGLEKLI